jgi:hypothetical protein
MTVKNLIKKLSKYNENLIVLGEFDSDGDDFMIKVDIEKIYKGNGFDDSGEFDGDKKEKFVIIKLGY